MARKAQTRPDPDSGIILVSAIKPNPDNPRTHSPEQIAQLQASHREFRWTAPVLLDEDNMLLAGHGRLMMATAEKLKEVPFRRLVGLSPAQKKALIIADNQLPMNAGWDEARLASLLGELEGSGFDLDILGFEDDWLDGLLHPGEKRRADPDATPPPPMEPVSRPGDVWLLGEHRLACGDCTDKAVVALAMGGSGEALTMTDPPYGIGYEYRSHDDQDHEANALLVQRAFEVAPPGGKVWTPGKMNLGRDIRRFGDARFAIWHKGFAAAGNGLGGASTLEPVLILDPPKKGLANDYLHFGTDREELHGRMLRDFHPCPKPVALYAHLLEAFSEAGARIFEPFTGSGTTLIACESTGRICHAIEIDPAYCDVTVARWEGFTGKAATRESDGATFRDLGGMSAAPEAEDGPLDGLGELGGAL